MFRMIKIMMAVCISGLVFSSAVTDAAAHELWVNAIGQEAGTFKGDTGYGHNFPKAEGIAEDRLYILKPLKFVTPDGKIGLDQVG